MNNPPTIEELHQAWNKAGATYMGTRGMIQFCLEYLAPFLHSAPEWLPVADAPAEHRNQPCLVTSGRQINTIARLDRLLGQVDLTRTHYMLLADLLTALPIPPDPDREAFDAWWRDAELGTQMSCASALRIWMAARNKA